jgi:periodic tryptophan protein 2
MKFGFKLSNILGSIYHRGTLEFSPDGNSLLSPVGNKVVSYDLKNNRSEALPIEAEYNIIHLSYSPNGRLFLAATEKLQLYLISQVSGAVLHRKQFHDLGNISCLSFSPDGRYFVVCGSNKALVYVTPGVAFAGGERQLSPFQIHKVVKAHFDDITCISWSRDSRLMALGSRDLSVKITAVDKHPSVPSILSLSGHSDVVTQCFFVQSDDSDMDIYSLCRNGQLYHWRSNMKNLDEDIEDGVMLNYRKTNRQFLCDHVSNGKKNVTLTAAGSSSSGRILVTGFSNGCFLVQDLQDLTVIYSLQLSTTGAVDSITINSSGDWIAIGSGVGSGKRVDEDSPGSSQSQLVVWEWKTETFVLKQSGTGAGVSNLIECTAYSPDAAFIATGSTDGKIRLWNSMTGFCFVTFGEEHRGSVTALEFIANKGGKVLVSASLDGTVRCFDMKRYRNFKTLSGFSEDKLAQFICMAVDPVGGDFIVAGAQNTYEIFLWSLQTGRLLECLAGHEGPVSGVRFHQPVMT